MKSRIRDEKYCYTDSFKSMISSVKTVNRDVESEA